MNVRKVILIIKTCCHKPVMEGLHLLFLSSTQDILTCQFGDNMNEGSSKQEAGRAAMPSTTLALICAGEHDLWAVWR